MSILRLSTLSQDLAIAIITLGFAAAPAFSNPADADGCHTHKDCGGGGGSGDAAVPLMTTFDCPVVGADHLGCPAIGSHNLLQADAANSPYENDIDNVLNRMGKTGRFALSTGKQAKKAKPRSVYWDVTQVNGESGCQTPGCFSLRQMIWTPRALCIALSYMWAPNLPDKAAIFEQ